MLARDDALFLPGHGPPLANPRPFVAALLEHRLHREAAILEAIRQGPLTPARVVEQLYVPLDPRCV